MFSLLYGPPLTSIYDYWKNHSFDYMEYKTSRAYQLFKKKKKSTNSFSELCPLKEIQNMKGLIVLLKEHLMFWGRYVPKGKGKDFMEWGT